MLTPTRLLQALGLTGLIAGCGSTIIIASGPSDAGSPTDTAVAVDTSAGATDRPTIATDTPALPVDNGTVTPPPPPFDGGLPFPGCVLPDGTTCAQGETCPSADRCALCRCTTRGLQCAAVPCVDGGVVPPMRTCRSSADCTASQLCSGPEGCGVPWTCQPRPTCTRDAVPWCSCEGLTFTASSSCPGRPVALRGPCPTMPPPLDAGPATCVIRGITCLVNQACSIDRCTQCVCSATGEVACRANPACTPDAGTIGVDVPPVSVDASAPGCRAQDARGEGLCDLLLGIYWQANRCVAVGGCRCVGADCASRFDSFATCEAVHAICPR